MKRLSALIFTALLISGCGVTDKVSNLFSEKKEAKLQGERIAVLSDNSDISVEQAPDDNKKFDLPVAVDSDFWSQLGGTPANYVPNVFALAGKSDDPIKKTSSAKAGDGNGWKLPLAVQPVIAGDKVFTIDSEGYVTARNKDDISKLEWSAPPVEDKDDPFAGGGLVYARGHLVALTGEGVVVSLAAETGKQEWKRDLNMPVRSAPKSDGKYVYIKSVDNQLFALDLETGVIMWKHQGISGTAGVLAATVPAIGDQVVIVPYSSGELYGLESSTGREVWHEMIAGSRANNNSGGISDISASPILADGRVYVGTDSGILSVLDSRNGIRMWERPFPGIAHIAVSGPLLFVTTTDFREVAVSAATGKIVWIHQLPGFGGEKTDASWMGSMVVSDNLAVFGRHGRVIFLSSATGKTISEVSWPNGIKQLPAIANKALYAVSDDATLYKIQ